MVISRLAAAALLCAAALAAAAQPVDLSRFDSLRFREIGPFRGGRSVAVAGVPGVAGHFYMGTTGGGLWKSTNNGVDWAPVTDGQINSGSVGAVAAAPSRPATVYLGMGETDIRGNISHGDGVYRSDDEGKTWRHLGLKETKFISKIRIHPKDPDRAWVAALGPVYGPSRHRGVFRTTDGGRTWQKTLYVNDRSGAISLVLDPSNPDRMFASTWEAWRTPWSLNSGGEGSRIWLSTDGGLGWQDITRRPGLPSGVLGKIGLTISPADPRRMWAIIEAADGGIFRSDDGGETWTKTNDDRRWRQRAWYYTHVVADPKDRDKVYVLNVQFARSTDGGKTFQTIPEPHTDNHDLWIDPENPSILALANDGGVCISLNGGGTWSEQDFPTAQMYHVSTDNSFPYNVLGAQQDNSTVRIPSRTRGRGITADDWTSTAGGESGYVAAKPDAPHIVMGGSYGGSLDWLNHQTRVSRDVSPWPDNPMGSGADALKERFQWTFPIVFSTHNPDVVYVSSQHLWRSANLGASWDRISPDLTRNDRSKMGPSGGPITKDNTSVEYYGTIFTVAESPRRRGVIWTGSDDGLIHITQDGGRTWTNVTPPGMPEWGVVSMIEASPTQPGRAWAAVDNHEQNDDRPYIFATDDFGKTWRSMTAGIDPEHFVRAVREDPVNPNLLFACTEFGLYVSFSQGGLWQRLALNLPVVPLHNAAIKDDDLVLATHGRSFWILDDLSVLRQAASKRYDQAVLFAPRDAVRARWGGGPAPGASAGANPPSGVLVNYWLPEDAQKAELEFVDSAGQAFMKLPVSGKKGLNRASAFLQRPSYIQPAGFIFWAAGPSPIVMPPGIYKVRLTVDGRVLEESFRWLKNPLTPATDRELAAQYDLATKVSARVKAANDAVLEIRKIREGLAKVPEAAEWVKQLTEIEEAIHQPLIKSGQDPLNYPIRLNNKLAALLGTISGEHGPTRQAVLVFEDLSRQLQVQLDRLDEIKKKLPPGSVLAAFVSGPTGAAGKRAGSATMEL